MSIGQGFDSKHTASPIMLVGFISVCGYVGVLGFRGVAPWAYGHEHYGHQAACTQSGVEFVLIDLMVHGLDRPYSNVACMQSLHTVVNCA